MLTLLIVASQDDEFHSSYNFIDVFEVAVTLENTEVHRTDFLYPFHHALLIKIYIKYSKAIMVFFNQLTITIKYLQHYLP